MCDLILKLLMQALPIWLIIFALGCGKKKAKTEESKRLSIVPKLAPPPAPTGNVKAAPSPPAPFLPEKDELSKESCKGNVEKPSENEEKNEEEIKPKWIPRTVKEEEIAKHNVTVNKDDYPTFIDVLSDWDSKKNKKVKRIDWVI